jgi:glycosyltransferase involved in cell wall biosynthesis
VDGTSEIIKHDENGWLVNTANLVDDLASSLITISKDEERRKRFSEKAIATINERYNAASMTRRIENIYTEIAKTASLVKDKHK